MSNSGPDQRVGYKLVPQLNSDDSELSEEELRSLSRDGFQVITKKLLYPSMSSKQNSKQKIQSLKKNMSTDFIVTSHKNSQITRELHCMPLERKILFVFSLIFCLIVIALFLLIPCSWASCSLKLKKNASSEIWIRTLPNIELVGPITPVYSVDQSNFNFVFLARGCIFADIPVIRTNFTSSFGGDALCLNGMSGKQMWRKHFNKMPSDLDCSILSSKNEAQKDCIVVSYSNFLTVVSAKTGQIRWTAPITVKNNKTKQSFPFVLSDLNIDNATNLLIARDVNKLMLLSGRQGLVLSHDFRSLSLNCSEIINLQVSNNYVLQLDCLKINGTLSNMSILLDHRENTSTQIIPQHQSFESLNRLFVRNLTIFVNNEGKICPRKCKAVVQINNFNNETIWLREFNFSYAMTPQSFDLTGAVGVYGFIFKIWEHEHENTEFRKTKMLQNSKKLTVNFINEHTYMVIFNSSIAHSTQTINISCYPIMQLYDAQKSVQPDPTSQKHSLFVTDIGNNGSYQLVSYYSTFEDEKKNNYSFTDYMLKSYVRMHDLRKEVLKIFNNSIA